MAVDLKVASKPSFSAARRLGELREDRFEMQIFFADFCFSRRPHQSLPVATAVDDENLKSE